MTEICLTLQEPEYLDGLVRPALGRAAGSQTLELRFRYPEGLGHKAENGRLKNENLMLQEGRCLGCGFWRGSTTLSLVLGQQTQKQGVQGPANRCVPQPAEMQVIIHVMVAYGTI